MTNVVEELPVIHGGFCFAANLVHHLYGEGIAKLVISYGMAAEILVPCREVTSVLERVCQILKCLVYETSKLS